MFYTGYEYDGDTGLNYAGARYYEAKIGRFISQDPAFLAVGDNNLLKSKTGLDLQAYLSDPQGFNSYAYARNNPLAYIDETGDFFTDVFGINISNGQRGVANSFHDLGNYFRSQGYIGHGAGFVSDMAGDVANNVANVFDPRQGTGTRLFAVGMTALDVGSGGKGSSVKKLTSNEIGRIGEKILETIVGPGKVHSYHMVDGVGKRFIDIETETAIHEAKNGYITASKKILEQVYKDSIIQANSGKEAAWHLFKGGSENAINALKEQGIRVIDYTK